MGIQSFSSIIQNFEIEKPFNDNDLINKKLYLDFNSLIHNISQDIISKINNGDLSFLIELENIFGDELTLKLEKKGEQIEYNKNNLDIIIIYYLIDFLRNKMKITQADFVYISIDGVPSVGKMTEQRQRKFMGKFEKFFKKKIIEKQDTNSQNISNTSSSSQNVSWDKINISPGTSFMKTLEEILKHKFNEPKYIISGSNEPGEGEHKISQHIKNNCNSNDIIYIFSPDNDANLLALINNSSMYTYIFKIDIKNSNPLDYKFVKNDINEFKEGLLDYFKQGLLDKYSDNDLLEIKNNIIDNIVLIYSFFGNDFIPNLESIDIRFDMTHLILTFKNILQVNNNFSLFTKGQVESNVIKYKFNLKNFMYYLNLLFKDVNFEKFLLRKKFFNSLFFVPRNFKKNYEKLNYEELSIFIDNYLTENKISYDMIPTSQVNDQTISNLGEGGGQGVPPSRNSGRNVDPGRGRGTGRGRGRGNQGYQPNPGRGRGNQYKDYPDRGYQGYQGYQPNPGRSRGNQYKDYPDRGYQSNLGRGRGNQYKDYPDRGYQSNLGRGRGNQYIKAIKSEPTIDSFKIQYEKYLGNTNLEDTESNRLNFTISKLFPNDDFNLGEYLQINKYNELGNYKANDSSDKFEELKEKFNKNYFVDDVGLSNAIENYIFGINWILEVYFNQDYNYYKYWFYPYEKSPLIMDIITYPNINNLYDDSDSIKEEFFDKFDDFKNDDNNISEIEQILFTTPDSDSYRDIYDKHPDIFNKIIYLYDELYKSYVNKLYFNLEDEVNYLFGEEKKKIVDCGNAFYLSKCSIIFANYAKKISFKEFKNKYEEILKDYRPEEEGKIDEVKEEQIDKVVKEKIEEGKIEEIKEEGEIDEEKKEVEEGLIGGYYKKYLKYKRKYLKLKNLY